MGVKDGLEKESMRELDPDEEWDFEWLEEEEDDEEEFVDEADDGFGFLLGRYL